MRKHRTTSLAQPRIAYTSPCARIVIIRHAADDFELQFDGKSNSSYTSESLAMFQGGSLLSDEMHRTLVESADQRAELAEVR